MQSDQNILLLTDGPGGTIAADLDVLYPGKVRRLNFVSEPHDEGILGEHEFVVTVVNDGCNLRMLDYNAVTAFADSGGAGHLLPVRVRAQPRSALQQNPRTGPESVRRCASKSKST